MSSNTSETRISDLLRKVQSQDATILHLKVIKLIQQEQSLLDFSRFSLLHRNSLNRMKKMLEN